MLNPNRLLTAIGMVLIALAISLAVTFADERMTDTIGGTIKEARVKVCVDTFTSCTNQCSTRAGAAPGSYNVCMQDCAAQYQSCMGAIGRRAPKTQTTGPNVRPSIAPPTPTPRKVSPERVNGVSTSKTTSTTSPARSTTPKPTKK